MIVVLERSNNGSTFQENLDRIQRIFRIGSNCCGSKRIGNPVQRARFNLFHFLKMSILPIFMCLVEHLNETKEITPSTSERSRNQPGSLFSSFQRDTQASRTSKVLDEFHLYSCEPVCSFYERENPSDDKSKMVRVGALSYWKKNAGRFPILASISKELFSVPASSGSVERVFSTATDIMHGKRNRMKPDLLEMRVFIKQNSNV